MLRVGKGKIPGARVVVRTVGVKFSLYQEPDGEVVGTEEGRGVLDPNMKWKVELDSLKCWRQAGEHRASKTIRGC